MLVETTVGIRQGVASKNEFRRSLRAKRSNSEHWFILDCFVATLLAVTF
jgi:hypothetical protein